MAANPQTLTSCALGKLDPDLASSVGGRIRFDYPGDFTAELAAGIAAGELQAIQIVDDSGLVGAMVYQVIDGRELLIIAAAGLGDHHGLNNHLFRLSEALAKRNGCESIRFHTQRPGMVRRGLWDGFHVSEIVLRKKV